MQFYNGMQFTKACNQYFMFGKYMPSKKGRKWSKTYKKSIHCNRPKGFSQKQYCKYGRNKKINI